jgi:hypothetical protein
VEENYQPIKQPNKIRAAVIGGAVMTATSVIPYVSLINCACCAGIMLGGLAAVYFYLREAPKDDPPMEAKYGIILGAFAGIFGAIFETVITSLIMKMFSDQYFEGIYAEFQRNIDQLESSGEKVPSILYTIRDSLDSFMLEIRTHGFSVIFTMFMLIFNTFKDVLFGLLGGLIGIYVLQKRNRSNEPTAIQQ